MSRNYTKRKVFKIVYFLRYYDLFVLGAVHKRRPQPGERGLSIADIFRTRGVLQKRTSALLAQNFGFFKIYGVSVRTRWEGGQFFAILCGRLLWTALYAPTLSNLV